MQMNHYVNVYERIGEDDELVKQYGPFSEDQAEHFCTFVELHNDDQRFYCLVVEEVSHATTR